MWANTDNPDLYLVYLLFYTITHNMCDPSHQKGGPCLPKIQFWRFFSMKEHVNLETAYLIYDKNRFDLLLVFHTHLNEYLDYAFNDLPFWCEGSHIVSLCIDHCIAALFISVWATYAAFLPQAPITPPPVMKYKDRQNIKCMVYVMSVRYGECTVSEFWQAWVHLWCDLGESVGSRTCDIFSFLFDWSPH